MSITATEPPLDPEVQHSELRNLTFEWKDLRFSIPHKFPGSDLRPKYIINGVSGRVSSGEMLAIMGPSGAGKSTMLDLLARRTLPDIGDGGKMTVNGEEGVKMADLAAYVEQSDALLGVLTVKETIRFAARLSLDPSTPIKEINDRVAATIADLGLSECENTRIGNPIQRGISGGQKRRVTIGSALVTLPKILLLDEPTSGLDSHTSREVMLAIKNIARRHGMIVIASIHQPNWETFSLFDKLLLLGQGQTMYSGPCDQLALYLERGLGHPVPQHSNPTDHALELVNTEFILDSDQRGKHIENLSQSWSEYAKAHYDELGLRGVDSDMNAKEGSVHEGIRSFAKQRRLVGRSLQTSWHQTVILMERNMINYARNLLAYGIRLGMYVGMGVMLATIWVNLAQSSDRINDRLSVHFFSVAFLGFMSVAGIPSFIEERQVFMRERMNGMYGPGAYVIANSICTLPYLFACSLLFCVLIYWSIGLHPGATPFFRFLAVLFLAVYTAESQSAVVAAAIPIFVAALAIASFLNGFWMSVGGYFIKAVSLPRFWYYWAHFIDFQTYAFALLVYNDFRGLSFTCDGSTSDGTCVCSYPSSLISQGRCELLGDDVLKALDIGGISFNLYISILLIIAIVYRVMLYVVLVFKKR
ncbi:hypothetical protein FRB95_010725 [Tulasnella sp. JGI-2019a]|nr:hypothetical protein FRB93_012958 [Tulasnella sp. JGI-2019a]KAG9039436.1 hypothetical protein FRB95_010725 [Tulasnella sp. JGI-2019a]